MKRWIVVLGGEKGPDVWINEENVVEGETILDAVEEARKLVESDPELSIHNVLGIDLD